MSIAPASGQIVNGGFENGDLGGWTPGAGASVEALQAANFSPNALAPAEGDWYALVSNGPGNVGGPGGDFDANGTADADGSTLSTTFTTTVAGETLSFQWAFLTDEIGPGGQGEPQYDDLFEVTVDGAPILRGSVRKPGGASPWADTPAFSPTMSYDGLLYAVASAGPTDGSQFGTQGGGAIPFQRVCIPIADPGTYTLRFLVADQSDSVFDSALLIDAVEVAPACDPMGQVTNTSSSRVEVKGGGLVFVQSENGRVSMNDDASLLAFRSNGNHTGTNPNLREQVWLAERSGPAYAVTGVTATVGGEYGDPDISGDGNRLAFASTADLLPPGNADGNREIFRYDRATTSFLQVTSTAGCTNEKPTINRGGDRIAFVSDCDLGISVSGAEIVLWDGAFSGRDTTGCLSRDPRISTDAAGRYVSFLTDCDGQYPGTSNPDGSLEVLQWDTQGGSYLEVTDVSSAAVLDGLASSGDGRYLSLMSDRDLEPGQNPANAIVPFRYDRNSGSFLQLAPADPLALFAATSIDSSGTFIAAERLDFTTAGFDIVLFDATLPGTLLPVAAGSSTVINSFPAVAVSAGRPLVAFQSDGNFSGNNADSNVEIWFAGASLDPPDPVSYCSTPGLTIPDRNNGGVTDVIQIPDTGTLADLDVFVDIEHTFVGDLRVRLRHLDTGTTALIIRRPGRPPGAGCSGDDIVATLDAEAGSPVENECVTPGPIAIDGSFTPDQSLDLFDGEAFSGDWELQVSDRRRGNFGTFVEWCLIATPQ